MVHRFIVHLEIIYVFAHGCKLKDGSMTHESLKLQTLHGFREAQKVTPTF